MSAFTQEELEYLATQRLGRLATVDKDGAPHVVPVGFRYNPEADSIDIGGRNLSGTKKWGRVQGNEKVSFVVDDVLPPWKPRGVEIRGQAQTLDSGGKEINPNFAQEIIRITPSHVAEWGISGDAYGSGTNRDVNK